MVMSIGDIFAIADSASSSIRVFPGCSRPE